MSHPASVTCRQIMNCDPAVLRRDDSIDRAVDMLLGHRYLAIPVIDDARRYLGMFGKSRLFGLMLPATVAQEALLPNMARVADLAFVLDDIADLRRRFDGLRDQPVRDYVDSTVPTVHPDTSLMEAMLLVYRTRNFLPVVEPDTDRLAGIISTWDILTKLRDKNDG